LAAYDAPMPAKNPRLTITLEPSLAAVLRRLSELTGNSQSAIIAEILEGSESVFQKIVRVLEAAEKAKAEVKGRAAANLEEAQSRMEDHLQLVIGEFDDYTGNLLAEVEAVSRRARKSPGVGERARRAVPRPAAVAPNGVVTPPSNRGVRSTANHQQKAKQKGRN